MRHLTMRVHAGVRAARAMHTHVLPRDLEQGGFKRALNRRRGLGLFLYLPAAVARAHVGDE